MGVSNQVHQFLHLRMFHLHQLLQHHRHHHRHQHNRMGFLDYQVVHLYHQHDPNQYLESCQECQGKGTSCSSTSFGVVKSSTTTRSTVSTWTFTCVGTSTFLGTMSLLIYLQHHHLLLLKFLLGS